MKYLIGMLGVLIFVSTVNAKLIYQDSSGNPISTLNQEVYGGNVNISYDICSVEDNSSNINQFYFSNFAVNITPNNFANLTQGTCKTISASVFIPNNTQSGIYDVRFFSISPTSSAEFNLSIKVLESSVYFITPTFVLLNMTQGQSNSFIVSINNTGNVKLTFNINIINNNESILWISRDQFVVEPLSSFLLPVYLNIPFNQTTPGFKFINISFIDNANTVKSLSVFIDVQDVKKPFIQLNSITPSYPDVGQNVNIKVDAIDDKSISSVWFVENDEIFTFDRFNVTTFQYNFLSITGSGKSFEVFVNDSSNNINSIHVNFSIKQKEYFNIFNNQFNFGKMRYRTQRQITIGKIITPTTMFIVLNQIQAVDPNITISLSINGGKLDLNTTVDMSEYTGEINLIVNEEPIILYIRNESTGQIIGQTEDYNIEHYLTNFYGSIRILVNDSNIRNDIENITFRGQYSTYSLTPPMEVPIIYVNSNGNTEYKNLSCAPVDTGVYENSPYDCKISYPGDVPERSIQAVTTVESYNNLVDGYEKKIDLLNLQVNNESFWKWVFLIIILLAIIASIVWWKFFREVHSH